MYAMHRPPRRWQLPQTPPEAYMKRFPSARGRPLPLQPQSTPRVVVRCALVCCSSAWNFLKEVMANTSAHGFNHLVAPNRHWVERVTWLLFLVAAIGGTLLLCFSTLERYQTSPVVTSLDLNYPEVRVVPPAVYICPKNVSSPAFVDATATRLAEEGYAKGNISHLKLFLEALANASSYDGLQYMVPFAKDDNLPPATAFVDLFLEVKHNFTGVNIRGGTLDPTFTEVGLCYADNSLVANWTSPNPEARALGIQRYPQVYHLLIPVISVGTYSAISSAYELYIHEPNGLPSIWAPLALPSTTSNTMLQMRAQQTIASDAVKTLNRKQRGCYTEKEYPKGSPRPLYSRSSCDEFCRMRMANRLCGCRPYFLNYTGIPACNASGMTCLHNNLQRILVVHNSSEGENINCNCLPACDGYSYDIKTYAEYPSQSMFGGANLLIDLVENYKLRVKRDVLFSVIDLFVSFGGAAGLCIGCSVLTMVELVYYFTLRAAFSKCQKPEKL